MTKDKQTRAEGPLVFTVRRPPERTLGFCLKMLLKTCPPPSIYRKLKLTTFALFWACLDYFRFTGSDYMFL